MKKGLLSCLIVIGFLEILTAMGVIDKAFFPNPILIFKNTFILLSTDDLLHQTLFSLGRLAIAFCISFPTALILALLSAHIKTFDELLNPLVALSFPLPKVALYPLLLLIFGIDSWSKISLISIGLFYLMFINFRIGFLRILSSNYHDIIKIYPLSIKNYYLNFLMAGTLQEILTGLKLALNYGLTLVVVSEISASNNGIGYFIWKSWDQFKIINVYSGVFVLSIIGFALYFTFNSFIEKIRLKSN